MALDWGRDYLFIQPIINNDLIIFFAIPLAQKTTTSALKKINQIQIKENIFSAMH